MPADGDQRSPRARKPHIFASFGAAGVLGIAPMIGLAGYADADVEYDTATVEAPDRKPLSR